jgi:hypothetical protein
MDVHNVLTSLVLIWNFWSEWKYNISQYRALYILFSSHDLRM